MIVASAVGLVAIQHGADLQHHWLRGEHVGAGPTGDEAELAERGEIRNEMSVVARTTGAPSAAEVLAFLDGKLAR